jgi:hypothetical protein
VSHGRRYDLSLVRQKDALVEAGDLLNLALQRFRWLQIVRICVEQLFHERERSSLVGPENGRGLRDRAQLGNRLAHDAFPRLDGRRLILLGDRLNFVLDFGLCRCADRVELGNVRGDLGLVEVRRRVLLDGGYVFSGALLRKPDRVRGDRLNPLALVGAQRQGVVRVFDGHPFGERLPDLVPEPAVEIDFPPG